MSDSPGKKDLSEVLVDFLTACAKVVLGLGTVAAIIGIGILVAICVRQSVATPTNVAEAVHNVEIFSKILMVGSIGMVVGSTYLYWGSEFLGVGQLAAAAILWFAPVYVPEILSNATNNEAVGNALGGMQSAGSVVGAIGILVLVVDLAIRARERLKQGVKADHLKYGKGIKEDSNRQNVFMGKCWQLPYCRQFVRDRCPIYHAKRTCWKEKVGCMCEEQVIRGAMENKPISKDALLAAKVIPVNNRLTEAQKIDRCRNCVIYNEHQKHKYAIALPVSVLGFIGLYWVSRGLLLDSTMALINSTNHVINAGTSANSKITTPSFFVEALLIMFMIVGLSYMLKMLEYLIFKLKL